MSFETDYISILKTQTPTGECGAMIAEVNRQLDKIPGLVRTTDDYGNIYVTKGKAETYPAFVCHLDTVHKIWKSFSVVRTELKYLFAYSEEEGFQQVGIGGDDKCGIIVCLELLTRLKTAKCAFFLDEEKGCKGSNAGDLSFFDNCRYAIQVDRKGSSDIITKGSGTQLCSPEFESFITELGKAYSYAPTTGASTDVVALKDRGLGISACNLSAGYYNPHTKQEYIDEDDLINCLNFCLAIAKIKTVYPHKEEKKVYTHSGSKYTSPPTVERRTCFNCTSVLFHSDGVICSGCIRDAIKLIDKNGEFILEQKSYATCCKCGANLYLSEEYETRSCEKCKTCEECGDFLDDEEEIECGFCRGCWYSVITEVCAEQRCQNWLTSPLERDQGYCIKCLEASYISYSRDRTCCLEGCEERLETDTEIENGVCDTCIAGFNYGEISRNS